jgi:hypothetical protein
MTEEDDHIVQAAIGGWMKAQVHWNECQDEAISELAKQVEALTATVALMRLAILGEST